MKRTLTGILLLMLAGFTFAAYTYAPSSVLSSGSFVKIRVSESGLHAISYTDLKKMGLTPESVRIYGYGGAMLPQNFAQGRIDDLPLVPVYLDKGADGIFNSGDRLIFFAQGPVSWSHDGKQFVHTRNTYSNFGYYFLTSDHGSTEEIATQPAPNAAAAEDIRTYDAYQVHELDSINLIDRTGEEGGGREFYGEMFMPGATRNFRFRFSGLVASEPMNWNISVAAASSDASRFEIQMDNASTSVPLSGIPSSDFYTKASAGSSTKTISAEAGELKTVALTFRSSSPTALGFLNYIELNAVCNLALTGNEPLCFRSKTGKDNSNYYQFVIGNATAETQVWDVTDKAAITRMNTTFSAADKQLKFTARNTGIREYVAFNPQSATYLSPVKTADIEPQNLHALSDIDYVIITPAEFLSEAQRLAAAHEEYDNMTVAVVTDQQVYNEFSSGTPDASAYRWLMKMLYDRANASGGTIHKPRYLCLFGDGTFDNRKLISFSNSGNNWLLTYQSKNSVNEVKAYATDDYFGFLDDNEGEVDVNGRMDIGVGRIPVNTLAQATGVVDKTVRYIKGENKGKWKNQLIFVADDGDSNLHTSCSDQAGEATRTGNPDFVVNKIYLDAYTQEVNASGESYPLAQSRLNNLLNSGALLFDYCGHSGYNNASSEGLVTLAGIRAMQNENPAFWIFASCSFALFDAGKQSAAEEAVLNPDGGAIAVCAACRTVYASQNATLNKHICNVLFDHDTPFGYHSRLGDAVSQGKNACGSDENKMSYVLLGDPAVSLHFPTDYQVRTSHMADTINALSVTEIEGFIEAENGDTASWFNGKLHISVYDKLQRVTTLDNDQPDESEKVKFTYNDYPNILFQGETTIRDGRFSCTFMVPKDIRYNFGNGRIVYYAIDTLTSEEGVGHYEDFIVGGSSPVEVTDTVGPELKLYLGTKHFQQGDRTNEKPHFYAEISDEHGINTVGSGIGHDLLLIVDSKAAETYVLNDYFSATNNSYQQGIVSYQMQELSEGRHSAFFRAWDLLNNSSSETIEFEVVKGYDPSIVSVLTYPNPVDRGGMVNIAFEYDQPDVVMQTDIFIYDLSGRLVHRISQHGTETVRWNVAETATPAGVYLYKVQLSSSQTKTCSCTGKLIITK